MILYFIVCILIILGIVIEDFKENQNVKIDTMSIILLFLFSFILVPILIGMLIQKKSLKDENSKWQMGE